MALQVDPSQTGSQSFLDRFKNAGDYAADQIKSYREQVPFRAITALGMVGSSALAAGLFTGISPLGGAIYGLGYVAAGTAGDYAMSWICDKLNCDPDSMVAQVAKYALPMIAGIGAGLAAVFAAGFPVTLGSAAGLAAGSVAILISGAIGAAIAVAGIVTPLALIFALYRASYPNVDNGTNPSQQQQGLRV